LQIAAANPISVDRSSVPAAQLDRERAIYREQVPAGKPANIIEKIVDGKIEKYYSTVCLVDQAFIKNPDETIKQLVAAKSKELGDNLVIRRFLRYSVGEQISA
jgi:elongation factor Ts